MQLTKRLNETEKNLQRTRSELFRLKLKLEEMSTKENAPVASPVYTAAPTRVVESLKHLAEKKEEAPAVPEKQLKERVVLQEVEPNVPDAPEPPTRQQTSIHESDQLPVEKDPVNEISPSNRSNELLQHSETESGIMKSHGEERTPDEQKQRVRMNSQVRVLYDDGDSTLEKLAEDKFTAGAKKPAEKPVGQQVQVLDVSSAPSECNQQ